MIVNAYLTINSRGTMKVTKTMPGVGFDEVAIKLQLDLPKALFEKPRLEAKITVPQSAVESREISAEVADNIESAIKSAAGMPVQITIVRPEDEDNG